MWNKQAMAALDKESAAVLKTIKSLL